MKYYFAVMEESTEQTTWQTGDIIAMDAGTEKGQVLVEDSTGRTGFVPQNVHAETCTLISSALLSRMLMEEKVAGAVGKILSRETFYTKGNKKKEGYLAEAFFIPNRAATPETEVASYTAGGLVAAYPAILSLLDRVTSEKEGEEPIKILLVKDSENNKILCTDPETGEVYGEITEPDQKLHEFLSEKMEAEAVVCSADPGENRFTVEISGLASGISFFYPEIDAAVKRCVAQAPELEEKVRFLIKSSIAPKIIRKILNQMSPVDQRGITKPKRLYEQKDGTNLSDALSYLLLGKLLRLVGEKGSGKNTLVETCAWILNRPLCRIQGSGELDKMDLLGSLVLKENDTVYEPSEMLQTLMEGGIAVVDEANIVRPDVLALMHSLTDSARSINLPMVGLKTIHPHAGIVYTMNEDYMGTSEMNAATIDRGPTLFIKQEEDLYGLLKRMVPKANEEDLNLCVAVSNAIRKAVEESGTLTRESITLRGYIDALESAEWIPLSRALVQNVANKAQSESERMTIESIIQSFCK